MRDPHEQRPDRAVGALRLGVVRPAEPGSRSGRGPACPRSARRAPGSGWSTTRRRRHASPEEPHRPRGRDRPGRPEPGDGERDDHHDRKDDASCTSERTRGYASLFPVWCCSYPRAFLPPEAVTAVDRLRSVRLEGNLGLDAALIARDIVHLAIASGGTGASATEATGALAASLLGSSAAGLAAAGRGREALLRVELLLGSSEGELGTAVNARDGLISERHRSSFSREGGQDPPFR